MNKYAPYKNREEHRHLNKMTALIIRCKLIMNESSKVIEEIVDESNTHIANCRTRKRKTDESNSSGIHS